MRIVDKGNDIIIEGHLYSLVCDTIGTATIKVYEDNTYLTSVTTDEYGFFHIVIPTSTVGVRNFKLIYEGDSNYTGSESTTIEVTVRDAPVLDEILLTSDTLVCQLGERFHFTATCQSQYDDDLANIQVQLKKDGTTIQTVTTGTDGKAYLKFTPNATGSYSITASSGNVSSDPIIVVVSEGNIYEIIADLNEFPGTYSKEEIDALLLALKTLLEETKADIGHVHQIKDIPNLQALLDDKVTWEAFYNSGGGGGGGGDVPIVANWTSNPSDTRVPSEKLVKNSLDDKIGKSSTSGLVKNDGTIDTSSYLTTGSASSTYQPKLTSGTNIKTINNESLLGSGNITIQGGGGGVDVVTSWEATLSDSKVPSEKLTKNTIDGKLDNALSSTTVTVASDDNILITDYSDSNKIKRVENILASQVKDGNIHSNISTLANSSQAVINNAIDSALGNKVSKSSTTGLLKNDGTVDTTSYSTFSGSYNDLSGKPTIPTKTSDLTNDGDGANVFVKNNDSRLTDSRTPTSHTHGNLTNDGKVGSNANYIVVTGTGGAITSVQKLGNITYDGKIGSTSGKPLITTTSGTVTAGSFGSTSGTFAEGNHTHSGYLSATKVTSWSSTPSDSNVASEKLVKDTFDDIEELIGDAITYINQ